MRLRWLACFVLLVLCGTTILVIWCHYQRAASLMEEEEGLIRSLATSVSAADGGPRQLAVAVFNTHLDNGSATRELESILDAESAFTWRSVSPSDVQRGALDGFDVVIIGGGSGSQKAKALGDDGRIAVQQFVRAGGGYVGICGSAFLATARYDWSLALVNAKTLTGKKNIPGRGTVSMAAAWCGNRQDGTDRCR